MATIVTTMLCVPAAILLAGACFLAGIPVSKFFSFGGALHPVAGLFAWWAIFFVPAALYSGYVVPWGGTTPSGSAAGTPAASSGHE